MVEQTGFQKQEDTRSRTDLKRPMMKY